jgi:hypothetical protein
MNYIWDVVNMERKSDNGFVVTAHYTVNAVDGAFSASTYGSVGYTQTAQNFVPFNQLTKAQVVGWVQNSIGKIEVEKDLANQIAAKKNPKEQSGLPWVA